ncbi:MAG: cytochrome c [Bacteroidia bacterium]
MKKSLFLFASGLLISIAACKSTKETTAAKETLNCGTTAYTLAADIQPLITSNCGGCHGIKGKKAGLDLTQNETVKAVAADGRLVCVMRAGKGCAVMPPGQPLSKIDVDKVECWVNNGMK